MLLKQKIIFLIPCFFILTTITFDYNSNKNKDAVSVSTFIAGVQGSSHGGQQSGLSVQRWSTNKLPQQNSQMLQAQGSNQSNQNPYTAQQIEVIQKIQNSQNYIELSKNCISRYDDPVIKKIYDTCTRHFFNQSQVQEIVKHDPVWQNATVQQRENVDFQSLLLTRSHHEQELESIVQSDKEIPAVAKRLLYDAIDSLPASHNSIFDYQSDLLLNFVHHTTIEIDNYPPEVKEFFMHPSGVLRRFTKHPYIQKHFIKNRMDDPELIYWVNTAIATLYSKSPRMQETSHRILNYARQSLGCIDETYSNFYKQQALNAYNEVMNPSLERMFPQLNNNYIDEFNQLEINPICEDRMIAFEKSKENNFHEYGEKYQITPEIKGFMQAHNINPFFYRGNSEANHFQHHMTKELLQIMHDSVLHDHELTDHLADFIDLSQEYNHAKLLQNCIIATDICEHICEYGKAVTLGLSETVVGVIQTAGGILNTVVHPINSVNGIISGISTLATNVGTYVYNKRHDKEKAKETEDQLKQMVYGMMVEYNNRSGPEKVRAITHFVSDYVCAGKALAAIGKFALTGGGMAFQTLRKNAAKIAESYSKSQFAQTSAGKVLINCYEGGEKIAEKAINTGNKVIDKTKKGVGKAKEVAQDAAEKVKKLRARMIAAMKKLMPCMIKLDKDIARITKKFGETTTTIFGKEMKAFFDFKHVFRPQPPTGNNLLKTKIRGFHHDFKNYIENFRGIKLTNKRFKSAFMYAEAAWEGGKTIGKTFFPSSWTREKVAEKIHEAFKNAVLERNIKTGALQAVGETIEGVRIRFFLKQVGNTVEITSAFPCKIWLLGL